MAKFSVVACTERKLWVGILEGLQTYEVGWETFEQFIDWASMELSCSPSASEAGSGVRASGLCGETLSQSCPGGHACGLKVFYLHLKRLQPAGPHWTVSWWRNLKLTWLLSSGADTFTLTAQKSQLWRASPLGYRRAALNWQDQMARASQTLIDCWMLQVQEIVFVLGFCF